MISLTAQPPFSLVLFRRRTHPHRLYVKDYSYRYTRLFMTKLGFISTLAVTSMGIALAVGISMLLR